MNDNSNQDEINKRADAILKLMNDRMLAIEYERAYDLISRVVVWFASPQQARNYTHRNMYELLRDFMEHCHCPYDEDDLEADVDDDDCEPSYD